LVTIGALAAVGRADWWPIGLVIGIISAMKWDPLFWWAGRLWGHRLIDVLASRSRWARMNAGRAEKLARKYGIAAILLTYVVPLPAAVIYATVGMAGMRLRTFLITDLIGSALICSLWVFLGFKLGQDAVNVVDLIARYSGYISIALVVIVIINVYIQSRRRKD
jgi:membrane protein DedA with SNARE-associated domain